MQKYIILFNSQLFFAGRSIFCNICGVSYQNFKPMNSKRTLRFF